MKKNTLSNYKAVILAGGPATRLYPITREFPKPLLPVKRKPILNYLVDLFYSYGIKEIAILINKNFQEDFDWWLKRYYPKEKIKLFEEKKPLGTFGGLWYLKDWISKALFFFANGDDLTKIDLIKMNDFHQKLKTPATLALVKVSNPQDYGVVVCKNGLVQKFIEKPKSPPTKYVSSGLYLFTPEIFNYHTGPKFLMIEKDIFPKLARGKKLAGFKFNSQWIDCGTWERYSEALKKWR